MSENTPVVTAADIERELAHESKALNIGQQEYRERVARLQGVLVKPDGKMPKPMETMTDYGHDLLIRAVYPTCKAIEAFVAKAKTGPGRRHQAIKYLDMLPCDVAALITSRVILDGITGKRTVPNVAREVGTRIMEEVKFSYFEQAAPGLFKTVVRRLDDNPQGYQMQIRKNTLSHAMKKFNVVWQEWSVSDRINLGIQLIHLFIEATGMVESVKLGGMQTNKYLTGTEDLMKWIAKYVGESELWCPFRVPTIIPPKHWTTPFDGGYYHKRMRMKLVKERTRGYLAELRHREMPKVYSAVNALQDTAWKVNPFMLEHITALWKAGLEVGDMPPREHLPLPVKPDPNDKEAYKQYKLDGARIFRMDRRYDSKRTAVNKILAVVRMVKDEPSIYFPYTLDFRGRVYAVPQYFNPQGCDIAKSLLLFAKGERLGADGVFWLGVHIANCWGYDKCSLQERVEWTRQHTEQIVACANDPIENRWWMDADKPFQFLAACCEWVGYTTDGEDYVCHLPVAADGSCNGIQNLSAAARDPEAGRHVNLVPCDKPADIYGEVAKGVIRFLESNVTASGIFPEPKNKGGKTRKGHKAKPCQKVLPPMKVSELARGWLEFGCDRSMCKRQVMVLPYGGTRNACRQYTWEAVEKSGKPLPFPTGYSSIAINWLSQVIWDVMSKTITGPRVTMDWLQQVAKQVVGGNMPITWSTPSGFLVQQKYLEQKARKIKTKVGDTAVFIQINEDTDKMDSRSNILAIAPNFVHSIDASHLVETVNLCLSEGITGFSMIHDSYGCLPSQMPGMQKCLRQAFVTMYSQHDVLKEFRAELLEAVRLSPTPVELPDPPAKGSLDITGVLRSDFFFA